MKMKISNPHIIGILIFVVAIILCFMSYMFPFPCVFSGHKWEDANCFYPKRCSVCGETSGEALSPTGDHEWEEATCTKAKTCIYCGESDGYSLGHDFVGASCVIAGKCSRCDERKTTEHNFEDGICIVCGKKQEIQKKKVETKGNNSYIYLDSSDYDFSRAVVAAQSLVKDRLNSPSTAKFPLSDYTVRHDRYDKSDYAVIGYVDSQNKLGATVRLYWYATFEMGEDYNGKYSISNDNVIFYN